MCLLVPLRGERLPQGGPGHADPVPVLTPARDLRTAAAAFATVVALLALAGCATSKHRRRRRRRQAAAPDARTPTPAQRSGRRRDPPVRPSPSPARGAERHLFRVGLKSDLTRVRLRAARHAVGRRLGGARRAPCAGPLDVRARRRSGRAGARVPDPGRRVLAGGAGERPSRRGSRPRAEAARRGRLLGRPRPLSRAARRLRLARRGRRRSLDEAQGRGPGRRSSSRGAPPAAAAATRRSSPTRRERRGASPRPSTSSRPRRTLRVVVDGAAYRGSLRVARQSARAR